MLFDNVMMPKHVSAFDELDYPINRRRSSIIQDAEGKRGERSLYFLISLLVTAHRLQFLDPDTPKFRFPFSIDGLLIKHLLEYEKHYEVKKPIAVE
jgi:hypothetical protein